ncbi:Conserved hypothetical protein [Candidatus Protochlamydia naegleriophila]|uniref:NADAR domain-containing protein n=1 Tax=Candidatus Protochlamydia naegleriophila TaxID=389348 RepID=A0A0U5J8W3_9BACT|nr:NADAR family protein [Candidatus Protochlamydia naegleriophila]CUI16216.1 Conserved hypothetical protein [Candidatus Protochlamydia naegleriophila]
MLSPNNLSTLIVEYEKSTSGDYTSLFDSKGGYPIITSKGWTLAKECKSSLQTTKSKGNKLTFSNREDYFKFLAQAILEEGNQLANNVQSIQKLVIRFNIEWTLAQKGKNGNFMDKSVNPILFNSKNKMFDWLSNFFPTLIFCSASKTIFSCVETAYKAHTTTTQHSKAFQELAKSMDPNKAKKINSPMMERSDEHRLKTMKVMIQIKFSQNPILTDWLAQTTVELVEHTDNSFWGDGSKTAEKGNGSNYLGKILMNYRRTLNEADEYEGTDTAVDDLN